MDGTANEAIKQSPDQAEAITEKDALMAAGGSDSNSPMSEPTTTAPSIPSVAEKPPPVTIDQKLDESEQKESTEQKQSTLEKSEQSTLEKSERNEQTPSLEKKNGPRDAHTDMICEPGSVVNDEEKNETISEKVELSDERSGNPEKCEPQSSSDQKGTPAIAPHRRNENEQVSDSNNAATASYFTRAANNYIFGADLVLTDEDNRTIAHMNNYIVDSCSNEKISEKVELSDEQSGNHEKSEPQSASDQKVTPAILPDSRDDNEHVSNVAATASKFSNVATNYILEADLLSTDEGNDEDKSTKACNYIVNSGSNETSESISEKVELSDGRSGNPEKCETPTILPANRNENEQVLDSNIAATANSFPSNEPNYSLEEKTKRETCEENNDESSSSSRHSSEENGSFFIGSSPEYDTENNYSDANDEESKDGEINDDDESTSSPPQTDGNKSESDQQNTSTPNKGHRLVGETVIIVRGNGTGIVTKVLESRKGGLLVNHTSMTGKLLPSSWVREWQDNDHLDSENNIEYPSQGDAVAALARSLVGHLVLIAKGVGAGLAGTVKNSHDTGLVLLDNPSLEERFVRAKHVRLLSDENDSSSNQAEHQGGAAARDLVGKVVRIKRGLGAGMVAKVVAAHESFISVDHPLIQDKFIHTSLVEPGEGGDISCVEEKDEPKDRKARAERVSEDPQAPALPSLSLVGKLVQITGGLGAGKVGRVLEAGSGGYLTVDNPRMAGKKVHVRNVEVIGDDKADECIKQMAEDDEDASPFRRYVPVSQGFLGKTVYVTRGTFKGKMAKVAQLGRNGYVMLEGMEDKLVHLNWVQMLEDDILETKEGEGKVDQGVDGDGQSDAYAQTLVGKTVFVKEGFGKGNVGIVFQAGHGGFILVDHPSMEGKRVHVRNVQVLKDGQIPDENNEMQERGETIQNDTESSDDDEEQGDDDGNDRRARFSVSQHFLGKAVYVARGNFKGKVGKVVKLGKNGYLKVDHPSMKGKFVHLKSVRLLDDMEDDNMEETRDVSPPDGEDNDGDRPSSTYSHPLLGTTVYVVGGSFAGMSGKVLAAGNGAYLTLDNPSIHKKVHVRNVRALRDGETGEVDYHDTNEVASETDEVDNDETEAGESETEEGDNSETDEGDAHETGDSENETEEGENNDSDDGDDNIDERRDARREKQTQGYQKRKSRGACRRLLGKFVRIIGGAFAGKSGKVKEVARGSAFIYIDHPAVAGNRVHVKNVREISDMQFRNQKTVGRNDSHSVYDPSASKDGQEINSDSGEEDRDNEMSEDNDDDGQRMELIDDGREYRNSPSTHMSASRRLLGKFVFITGGTFAGRSGKVIEVASRSAFLYIDHPAAEGKRIHIKNVREVDETQYLQLRMDEGDDNRKEFSHEDSDVHDVSSAAVSSSVSLLGKTVYIFAGTLAGKSGKVIEVGKGAYLTLDNPFMGGKRVHMRNVRLLDEMQSALLEGGDNPMDESDSDPEDDLSREDENEDCDDASGLPVRLSVSRSLLGKLVHIQAGYGRGIVGRVMDVRKGAHLVVDHPFMEGKNVHLKNVRAVDEMQDDNAETKTWHPTRPQPPPKPAPIMVSEPVTAGSIAHLVLLKLGKEPILLKDSSEATDNNAPGLGEDEAVASVAQRSDVDTDVGAKRAPEQDSTSTRGTKRVRTDLGDTTSIQADRSQIPGRGTLPASALRKKAADESVPHQAALMELSHSSQRILPPIVLEGDGSELPKCLSHLSPDLKVDVFNLRTGKVMTGDEAVAVRDLPELLQFAEYEPIIPPPVHVPHQRADEPFVREGRSGPNVRICSSVRPQERPSRISFRDQGVVIKQGPFSGCIGFITHRYPGGRYQVETIKDGLKHNVTVSAGQFELLPEPRDYKQAPLNAQRESEEEKLVADMFTAAVANEFMTFQRSMQASREKH